MISQIPTPQRTNNKVIGEFYPLQKEELIALKKAKLINNTAFIHLARSVWESFLRPPGRNHPQRIRPAVGDSGKQRLWSHRQTEKAGSLAGKEGESDYRMGGQFLIKLPSPFATRASKWQSRTIILHSAGFLTEEIIFLTGWTEEAQNVSLCIVQLDRPLSTLHPNQMHGLKTLQHPSQCWSRCWLTQLIGNRFIGFG